MKTMAVLLTVSLAAGCTYSLEPLGTEPAAIDPAEWEGTWQVADEDVPAIEVEVVDGASGLLRISGVDEDGERHELDAMVRRLGDWTVVSVPLLDIEDIEFDGYVWLLVEIDGNVATVLSPETGAFRELIDGGWLPGDQDDDDLIVGFLEPHHLELIAERRGTLFGSAQVARRIPSLTSTLE